MSKLRLWLPAFLVALILFSWAGSIVIKPGMETAPSLSSGYLASRSVCGASPPMVASLVDRIPAIGPASGLFQGPERLIRANLPATALAFSEAPKMGDAIGRIVVRTAWRFL